MAESAAPNTSVPVVKAPNGAAPKPVEDVVNYSKRSIDPSEFFADIPPDDLLDALNDDGEPEEEKPRRRPKLETEAPKPKAKPRKSEPEPEPEEEEEEPLAAADDEQAEDEPEREADEEPEVKAWAVPDGKGTKDAPLTLKDLPEDVFLELQVNGEKVVVDLKESAKGIMRRQAFDQQTSKIKQGLTEAHDIAEKAVSAQERMKQQLDQTRQGFSSFIRDPKRVLAALFENVPDKRAILKEMIDGHEDALEEIAFGYADFRRNEDALQKDGYAQNRARRAREREQLRHQREQASLAEERRRIAEERQAWQREQEEKTRTAKETEQKQAAARAAFAMLKPGLDAGLLALGMKDMTEELKTEVQVRLDVTTRMNGGKPLTSDDVKKAVIRAGESLGIKPGQKQRPAPANGTAPRRPAAQTTQNRPSNGSSGGKFDNVPQNQRVRTLEWYLDG
jgi:hypothetical protein